MSEESVFQTGSSTISTPRITGFYPATPAPVPAQRPPVPVQSTSTQSQNPPANRRLERLKDAPSEVHSGAPRSDSSTAERTHLTPAYSTQRGYQIQESVEPVEQRRQVSDIKGKGKQVPVAPQPDINSYFTPVQKKKMDSQRQPLTQHMLPDAQLARHSNRPNGDETVFDQTHIDVSRITVTTPHPPGWFASTPAIPSNVNQKKRRVNSPPDQSHLILDRSRHTSKSANLSETLMLAPSAHVMRTSSQSQQERTPSYIASNAERPQPPRPSSATNLTKATPPSNQNISNTQLPRVVQSSSMSGHTNNTGQSDHPADRLPVPTNTRPSAQQNTDQATLTSTSTPTSIDPRRPDAIILTHPSPNDQTSLKASHELMRTPPRSTRRPADHVPKPDSKLTSRVQTLRPSISQMEDASMTVNCLSLLQQSIHAPMADSSNVNLMNLSLPPISGGDYSTFEAEDPQHDDRVRSLLAEVMGDIQELKASKTSIEALADT